MRRKKRKIDVKNGGLTSHLTSFFNNYKDYLITSALIFALFNAFLGYFEIFPFGKYSMASYDLLAQICPFLEHYFDFFEGKSNLFYSFAVAGGADVGGTLAYCSLSPFTFLYLVAGRTNTVFMVAPVLLVKIICIACSAIYFIKHTFNNIGIVERITLASLYAFSGYLYVANTYSNWVDFLIYIPLLICGFKKLIDKGSIRLFTVALTLILYTCFSIACFSLLIIYCIIFCYLNICVDRSARKEKTLKTVLSLVLAVVFALPVLVPSLLSYLDSGRNTGLFENVFKKVQFNHLYNKTSYVFVNVVIFCTGSFYFFAGKSDKRLKIFLLIAAAFVYAPVLIDECCNLLNAGSYMSYALRFGFLNSGLGLFLAGKCLNELSERKTKVKWKHNSLSWFFVLTFVLLSILAVYLINDLVFNGKDSFIMSLPMLEEGTELYSALEKEKFCEHFSSAFAHSLGGLEGVAVLFGVIGCGVVLSIIFYKSRFVSRRSFSVFIALLSFVQIFFCCEHLVYGNRNNMNTYQQFYEHIDALDKTDGEIIRIKDNNNRLTNNLGLFAGTGAFSVFSSVINNKNFTATSFFDYDGNNINSQKSGGGTMFSDCLFGYQYFFTMNSIDRSYTEKLADISGNPIHFYYNNYAFPIAFTIPKSETQFQSQSRFETLNYLYELLGGDDNGVAIDKELSITENDDGSFSFTFVSEEEGTSYFEFILPDDVTFKYVLKASYNIDDSKNLEDTIDLGYYKNSRTKTITIKQTSGKTLVKDDFLGKVRGYVESTQKVIDLYEIVSQRAVTLNCGKNGFACEFSTEEDCNLFISYVNIDGLNAKINGKSVSLLDNSLDFIIVDAQKGTNEVKITYTSPFLIRTIIAVVISVFTSVALLYLYKKKYAYIIKLNGIIYWASVAVFAVVFLFFFAFPTVTYLVKLFGSVF